MLDKQVWYAMGEEGEFQFPGWDRLFIASQPVKIEYCSGNGLWLAERAQNEPNANWMGLELKFDRIKKIWSKIENRQLKNLLAVWGEGFDVTKRYIPDNSVSEVYVNFPDPWPKRRHAKYRIIQPLFAEQIHRILQPEGTVSLVTDDVDYSKQMVRVMTKQPGFASCYPEPHFVTEYPGYGPVSYFEDLWRSQGKGIRYHLFKKVL